MIRTDRFKDGKQHIVTMSYDDGPDTDLKLIEIFNKYGIKGTFNLISGSFDNPNNWLQAKDVPTVYAGHEIACHTVTHPHLEFLTPKAQYDELMSCRLSLEKASGQIVRGLAFPFGTWSDDTLNAMRVAGLVYSRAIEPTSSFLFPENFMTWRPTNHHNQCMPNVDQLIHNITKAPWRVGSLLYIWGHSYEFRPQNDNNWELIDTVCQKLAEHSESIWFATNIEVVDYKNAISQIQISADEKVIRNPTAIDLWVSCDKEPLKIPAGETVRL